MKETRHIDKFSAGRNDEKNLVGSFSHALTNLCISKNTQIYQFFTITKKTASKQGFHNPFNMRVFKKTRAE